MRGAIFAKEGGLFFNVLTETFFFDQLFLVFLVFKSIKWIKRIFYWLIGFLFFILLI
jgi:hypothetical protein